MDGIFLVSRHDVENTPSTFWLPGVLGDPKNSILFVGYCDPSTPGGKLAAQQDETFEFDAVDVIQKQRQKFVNLISVATPTGDELYPTPKKFLLPLFCTMETRKREWFKQNLKD